MGMTTQLPTGPPPAWLAYATPTVALLALLIAICSLLYARATYHRSGPKVRVRTELVRVLDRKHLKLYSVVNLQFLNAGLARVYVEEIVIRKGYTLGRFDPWAMRLTKEASNDHSNPFQLPIPLEPGKSVSGSYTIRYVRTSKDEFLRDSDEIDRWLLRARIYAVLGTGAVVKKRFAGNFAYAVYVLGMRIGAIIERRVDKREALKARQRNPEQSEGAPRRSDT